MECVGAFNSNALEEGQDESLWVRGIPDLHSEFQGSQGYIIRSIVTLNSKYLFLVAYEYSRNDDTHTEYEYYKA